MFVVAVGQEIVVMNLPNNKICVAMDKGVLDTDLVYILEVILILVLVHKDGMENVVVKKKVYQSSSALIKKLTTQVFVVDTENV